jgi:hypothetical protein
MWIPAERTTRVSRLALIALGLAIGLFFADDTFGQAPRGSVLPVIRSVRTEAGKDGSTMVVVEGTGPLPEPSSGVAATPPPRIYLDFTDVLPDLNLPPVSPTALVKAVRVAEHTASPLVTRVVINLAKATTYRVDTSGRSQGRIAVVLSALPSERAATAPPPAASATKPSAPATSARPTQPRPAPPPSTPEKEQPRPVQPPSTPAPPPSAASPPTTQSPAARGRSDAAESQYGIRISSALVRLHALRLLLEAIDRRADPIPGDLNAAAAEFDAIGKLLSGIKPPSNREGTHALLLRTCTLGARAVRMRQEASATKDAAKGWDAASAAAGALMMFDKANTDLAK